MSHNHLSILREMDIKFEHLCPPVVKIRVIILEKLPQLT